MSGEAKGGSRYFGGKIGKNLVGKASIVNVSDLSAEELASIRLTKVILKSCLNESAAAKRKDK